MVAAYACVYFAAVAVAVAADVASDLNALAVVAAAAVELAKEET